MKNVCFLFGINGVGKSTIAGHVVAMVKGSVRLSSSEVLRRAFGGISRDALEMVPVSAKRDALRASLTEAFETHERAPLVICEMHLVACIRRDGIVNREHMWSESFRRHGRTFCLVSASADAVLRRREHDMRTTGRVRGLDPAGIADDALANEATFRGLFSGKENAFISRNHDSAIEAARLITERSTFKVSPQVLADVS